MKSLLENIIVRGIATSLSALYIFLVQVTTRWKIEGADIPQAFWERNESFLLAVWHGRLLMVAPNWPREKPISALISKHQDGELIARTVSWFGFNSVRGSSGRDGDGAIALRQVVNELKKGTYIVFTPDGPHGPHMRASDGVVTAARLSGAAVVPFATSSKRRKLLNSWDRFLIPLPFTRGAIVWGEPIKISRNASKSEVEDAKQNIERSISNVTERADLLLGHKPILADPSQPKSEILR